jgi:hypothetical protein
MSKGKGKAPNIGNIHKKLAGLQAAADSLMSITKEQEAFAKRKQECFLDLLNIVEKLATVPKGELPSGVIFLINDSNELLEKYKEELGKEPSKQ